MSSLRVRIAQIAAQFLKELKIVLRDWHALGVLFLMPACFVLLLSLALQDLYQQGSNVKLKVLIEEDGAASLAKADLAKFLSRIDRFDVLSDSIRDPDVSLIIHLPEGIDKAFDNILNDTSSSAPTTSMLRLEFAQNVNDGYRDFAKGMLTNYLYEVLLYRLEKRLGSASGGPKIRPDVRKFISDETPQLKEKTPNPLEQNVPGWSLFAMFFVAIPLAGSVIRERSDGTLKRIMSYSVSRSSILIGKTLPYIFINAIQFVLMVLVGVFVLPLISDLKFVPKGDVGSLVLLTLIVGSCTTSFAIFVASVAKSVEHATALVGAFVIILSVIGGIMVPVFAMPLFMKHLALFSPFYWGHQAYLSIMVYDKSFVEVLPYVYKLLGFSICCALLSIRRFRWL